MKEMQFQVEIHAPKEKVWDTMWQDKTFRDWAGMIDPGTYMKGTLAQSKTVEFISAENGYGVTSFVEKLTNNEYLLLRHQSDTQASGKQEREPEWTGGKESYTLTEKDGTTTLTAAFDVPSKQEEYFSDHYPKALARVKELTETSTV